MERLLCLLRVGWDALTATGCLRLCLERHQYSFQLLADMCCQNSCTGIAGGSWWGLAGSRENTFTTQYFLILAGLGFLT